MLVAPLFHDELDRDVYLPPGQWTDYQSGKTYSGGWHHMEGGSIPIVALVREGSVIPHIALAQSTEFMDWSKIDLKVYPDKNGVADGLLVLPGEELKKIVVEEKNGKKSVKNNPYGKKVKLRVL